MAMAQCVQILQAWKNVLDNEAHFLPEGFLNRQWLNIKFCMSNKQSLNILKELSENQSVEVQIWAEEIKEMIEVRQRQVSACNKRRRELIL